VTPSWPDDPETIEEAREHPEVFARKTLGQVADHVVVMGHSTGGLLAQMIADRGLSAATVAIDPGPFRGVLPLPISSLRSAAPVLANPLNRNRAVMLTLDQFKYGWANALSDEEAKELYDGYHVATPGVAFMQMANANLNPWTEAKLNRQSKPRAAADHRGGEGPHGPVGDRQRRLQATASQPGRDGDHEGPQPWPLADHRQRLAGGSRPRAAVRAAIHLAGLGPTRAADVGAGERDEVGRGELDLQPAAARAHEHRGVRDRALVDEGVEPPTLAERRDAARDEAGDALRAPRRGELGPLAERPQASCSAAGTMQTTRRSPTATTSVLNTRAGSSESAVAASRA
jgi:hypothetical protein